MDIGAIADDLTGGTDLALTLSRAGMRVVQTIGAPEADVDLAGADAVVVSLKSRTIPPAEAVAQSVGAADALLLAGARQIVFKYCSTFDSTDQGNIGPVTDALLERLGERRTIACPAFPANRRTVYKGHLFVGDQLLSDSPMRDHPLTPMRDANLVRVLGRQSRSKIALIDHDTVRRGAAAISAALGEVEGVAIVDAITDEDLRAIGAACSDLRLVTGGSGIAMGLPANFGRTVAPVERTGFNAPAGRSVALAGSCSVATRAQINHAIAAGVPAFGLDALNIANGRTTVDDVVRFALDASGAPPLIYSSAAPERVAAIQAALGRERAGEIVEAFLARVACALADRSFRRFVVAGGETSGAVVAALGVPAIEIGPEIAPGVPWTRSRGRGKALAFALKSGNFGDDSFFSKAWEMVK